MLSIYHSGQIPARYLHAWWMMACVRAVRITYKYMKLPVQSDEISHETIAGLLHPAAWMQCFVDAKRLEAELHASVRLLSPHGSAR